MVKKDFLALREFGSITIRVNSKNNKIPPPKPIYYFQNGDNRGVMDFTRYWVMCRKLGMKDGKRGEIKHGTLRIP
jgi:hypothetical protein